MTKANRRFEANTPTPRRTGFPTRPTRTAGLAPLGLILLAQTAAAVQPDLQTRMSASPTSVAAGGNGGFQVSVANPSYMLRVCERDPDRYRPVCYYEQVGADAYNVRVSGSLGSGALTGISGSSGLVCNISGPTQWSCAGGTVAQDSTATIAISTRAPSISGTMVASATADPAPSAIAERSETNNSASASVAVTAAPRPLPDLAPTASGSPTTVTTGKAVDYWVYINNMGNAPATSVRFQVNTNFAARFATPYIYSGGWSCYAVAGVPPYFWMQCSGGTIAANGSATFLFKIGTNTPGPNCLTVLADPNNELDELDRFGNSTATCVNMP